MKTFKEGDKVAYSIQFLASIGMSHSDMAHARGVVESTKTLVANCTLASIAWNCDMPKRVNIANLAHVGPNRRFCNVD